ALPEGQVQREPAFAERQEAQKALGLPALPTTTIGSFPQTSDIRKARADHRAGNLTDEQYVEELRKEVASVIELQERLGLDVLGHAEPERNAMVQYFAELLDGFVVTATAGSSLMAPVAPVHQSWLVTSPVQRQ